MLLLALVAYFQYVLYSMDNNVALLSLIVVDVLCVALIMQVLNAEKKKDFQSKQTIMNLSTLQKMTDTVLTTSTKNSILT